jgi:PPOX class probable F420-dependent enzyme
VGGYSGGAPIVQLITSARIDTAYRAGEIDPAYCWRMTTIPDGLLDLLTNASPCFIATLDPDGSPQLTETWVGTDGERIVINTVEGFRKVKNVERDPRVSVIVTDPADASDYYSIKGRVVEVTKDGAAEHIDELAHKYIGGPYPWFGGRDQVRLKVIIEIDKVIHAPWK